MRAPVRILTLIFNRAPVIHPITMLECGGVRAVSGCVRSRRQLELHALLRSLCGGKRRDRARTPDLESESWFAKQKSKWGGGAYGPLLFSNTVGGLNLVERKSS